MPDRSKGLSFTPSVDIGFMNSFFEGSNISLTAPNYTTICKRSGSLSVDLQIANRGIITDIVAESTGLKVYGEGEWKVRKHGPGKHRNWMKMHLAADETT